MGFADKFDINPNNVPPIKLGLHGAQILLALIIFIMEIVLFRTDGAEINSKNGWVLGLCLLSIPGWIYLGCAPRFERTRQIAQPHAMTVVDAVYAIFWLSGFASQAAYNTANSCGQGCGVSKGIVALAFFEILLWIGSTLVSFYTLQYYHQNGDLPGYENLDRNPENIDPDKAAFSMAPHDEEAYAPIQRHDHDDHHDDDHDQHTPYNADTYGSHNSNTMFDSDHSYQAHGPDNHRQENPFADNAYGSSHNNDPYSDNYGAGNSYDAQPGGPQIYAPPSAEDYDDNRPAKFPAANYDRTMH